MVSFPDLIENLLTTAAAAGELVQHLIDHHDDGRDHRDHGDHGDHGDNGSVHDVDDRDDL